MADVGYRVERVVACVLGSVALPTAIAQVLADRCSTRQGAGPVRTTMHLTTMLAVLCLLLAGIDPSQVLGVWPPALDSLFLDNAAALLADSWAVWMFYALRTRYKHLCRPMPRWLLPVLCVSAGAYTLVTNLSTVAATASGQGWWMSVDDAAWVALGAVFCTIAIASYLALSRAVALLVRDLRLSGGGDRGGYWKTSMRKLAVFTVATSVVAGASCVVTALRVPGDLAKLRESAAAAGGPPTPDPRSYTVNQSLCLLWAGVLCMTWYAWMPLGVRVLPCMSPCGSPAETDTAAVQWGCCIQRVRTVASVVTAQRTYVVVEPLPIRTSTNTANVRRASTQHTSTPRTWPPEALLTSTPCTWQLETLSPHSATRSPQL